MTLTGSINKRRRNGGGVEIGIPVHSQRNKYTVVLDGIQNEIETIDSFAIKFGLLTNMPVTKARHLLKKLPENIWSGTSQSRAQGLLSLIVEAGGAGRVVVEESHDSPVPGAAGQSVPGSGGKTCVKCGFPMKMDDQLCQFCLTPVNGGEKPRTSHAPTARRIVSVPPARLVFYLVVVFAALIAAFIIKV